MYHTEIHSDNDLPTNPKIYIYIHEYTNLDLTPLNTISRDLKKREEKIQVPKLEVYIE